jgi:ferredoxin-NADP reductase
MQNNKREFILVDKKYETMDVISLLFRPVDNLNYDFIPGQYIDVKPPLFFGHSKSYTMSSTSNDSLIRLTIKRNGNMSSSMIDMPIGSTVVFNGPYGNFYPDKTMDNIVMIAGGIGITPFYSVIKNKIESGSNTKITLIYSNKTKKDITFFKSLNELMDDNPNLKIVHCITREITTDSRISENGRIDENIISEYASPLKEACYYVCGSIGFVDNMWQILKSMHIKEDEIYTEAFY